MNRLSQAIRKFNRFELKYVITLQEAEQLKQALRRYLVPDEHGNSNGRYALSSLYYDSPDLRCYQEKLDGIKFRRKLRIRCYEAAETLTADAPVFVEIKQRVDRVTQKRRVALPYHAALRLCNDREMPHHEPDDRPAMEEIYVLLWQYNLLPACMVLYDRQAFVGTEYDIGLRVTFDTSLSFQAYPLHLHERSCSLPMLSANLVVMEIKVNDRIPYWLTELILVHNLQLLRISKYCRAIDVAQDMLSACWRAPLAESSEEALSSVPSLFSPPKRNLESSRQQRQAQENGDHSWKSLGSKI